MLYQLSYASFGGLLKRKAGYGNRKRKLPFQPVASRITTLVFNVGNTPHCIPFYSVAAFCDDDVTSGNSVCAETDAFAAAEAPSSVASRDRGAGIPAAAESIGIVHREHIG